MPSPASISRSLLIASLVSLFNHVEGIFLPAIFKPNMVLQTPADGGSPASLFGFVDTPGESVEVNMTIEGVLSQYHVTSDSTVGNWSVRVAPPPSSPQWPSNVSFSIAAASDASPTLLWNVAFGEVILCNGQSNMVLSIAAASDPIGRSAPPSPPLAQQTWPTIRLFSVITQNSSAPTRDLPPYINATESRCTWGWVANMTPAQALECQTWQVAAPGITDFFSAECFYTAHALITNGAFPPDRVVGLVQSAYSGTAMETWIPPEALDGCPASPNLASPLYDSATVSREALQSAASSPLDHRSALLPGDIPSAPNCLWNDMIFPIVGFGLRAVLHNQIESNMGDGFEYYSCVFQNMIATWRDRWGIGPFPFLSTSLGDQGFSPDSGGKNVGFPNYVATPRDGQLSILHGRYPGVSRTVAGGLVSTYDRGDRVANPFGVWDVHSRFKGEIGRRMALVFQNVTGLGGAGAADWNGPYPAENPSQNPDGTITLSWATGSGKGVYINGTQDCWECCSGAVALDTFQVTSTYAGLNMTRSGAWINTSWVYDEGSATVTLSPTEAAPPGKPYIVVRYAASLWPQCAFYSSSNDVPAFTFSDLNITIA